MAMYKGHLDQTRKNQRSTKFNTTNSAFTLSLVHPDNVESPLLPITELPDPTKRSHHIFAASEQITGKIASDPTGKFIVPSSNGNTYILVVYDYDSNMIFAEPMKSRSAADHLSAYKTVHATLRSRGLAPQLQRLDNEASTLLKNFLTDNNVDYQLVPPHAHRRNQAERAIRVFKNHFIAGLCSTHHDFPLHLWDRLLPQALITLNLLRTSHINPKLSAQALIFGLFDFNRTPLAPPGTKVLIHAKPNNRETWAPHGVDGWYLGPALEHYRCYRVYANETKAERIADTLAWFPTTVTMPTTTSTSEAIAAANDLVTALSNPTATDTLAPMTNDQRQALHQLAEIFQNRTQPTSMPVPPEFDPLPDPPTDTPLVPRVPNDNTQHHTITPDASTESRMCLKAPIPAIVNAPDTTTYLAKTTNPSQRRRQRRKQQQQQQSQLEPTSTNTSTPVPTTTGTTPPPATHTNRPNPTKPNSSSFPRHDHNTRYRALSVAASTLMALSLQQHITPPAVHPLFANAVTDPNTGATLEYRDLLKTPDRHHWEQGWCNEFNRLGPKGTKTIKAIAFEHIPKGRAIGNIRVVAALKPLKAEMHRIRFTIAHHHHDYTGATSTPTVDMPTVKCHINSTISTEGARYATMDISDFYLNTLMARPEYMRIPLKSIPQQIIDEYHLNDFQHNGYIYFQVDKGLYGLVQAGKLAYDQLLRRLTSAHFYPAPHANGLFLHHTRPISFTLCVDDFGVKYTRKEDIEYLVATLQQDYKLTIDWTGSNYLGLSLQWDYTNRTVDISMPGYIEQALHRFQHPSPARPQHSPHAWTAPDYGATTQWAMDEDHSPALHTTELKTLQQILGTLLYYARDVDNTMLVAISTLASVQAKGTEATMVAAIQLLNYCATHPNASVRYKASDMILHVHSDASYLSVHGARSRVGGYFFLSQTPPPNGYPPNASQAPLNGPVHVNSIIMTNVMSSAAEAELGALFHNCKDAEMLRSVLIAMGHPQPATPVQTDNACASGIANDTVKQKRSRAMDMRFYWVRDRVRQDHFYIFWAPGDINIADYYTKHFAPSHHRVIRSTVLHSPSAHSAMQGCVDLRQRQPHCLAHDPLGIITSMLQPGSTLVVPSLISPLPTISPIV